MAEKPAHEFVLDDGDCTTAVLCPICGDVLTAANDEQVGTDTYTSGSSYEPELEGYTYGAMNAEGLSFIGWSLTEGGDVVTSTLWPDSDLAFYAVYQKLHTITYYYYNIDSLDYFEEGSVFTGAGKVTLYTNYSNYYTILGWDADGDGKADYECGEQITLSADMVLYEVVAPCSATIDLGAEDAVYGITEVVGEMPYSIAKLTTFPIRPGYIFKGFVDNSYYGYEHLIYTDEETGEYYIEIGLSEDDLTLTALWEVCTEHNWQDATCTTPKTCVICQKTEGDPVHTAFPVFAHVDYFTHSVFYSCCGTTEEMQHYANREGFCICDDIEITVYSTDSVIGDGLPDGPGNSGTIAPVGPQPITPAVPVTPADSGVVQGNTGSSSVIVWGTNIYRLFVQPGATIEVPIAPSEKYGHVLVEFIDASGTICYTALDPEELVIGSEYTTAPIPNVKFYVEDTWLTVIDLNGGTLDDEYMAAFYDEENGICMTPIKSNAVTSFDLMKHCFTRENYALIALRIGDTLYTSNEPIFTNDADLEIELIWQCNHVTDESLLNEATCELPITCPVCGYTDGEAMVHGNPSYTINGDTHSVDYPCCDDQAVLTLLNNITLKDREIIRGGVFTLDLNGFTLSAPDASVLTMFESTELIVTITDSKTTGVITGTIPIVVFSGTVIINSGSIISTNFYDIQSSVVLDIGKNGVGPSFPGGIQTTVNLNELLADGAAYWQGNTMILPAEDSRSIAGAVVIKPACSHENVSYTYVEHSGKYHGKVNSCCGGMVLMEHQYGDDSICDDCGYDNYRIAIDMAYCNYDGWNHTAIKVYKDGVYFGKATIWATNSGTWSIDYDPNATYEFYWELITEADGCSFDIIICVETVLAASRTDCAYYKNGQLLYTNFVPGWKEIDGCRYYFSTDGSKATDITEIDGILYAFDHETGVFLQDYTGIYEAKNGDVYFVENGIAVANKGLVKTVDDNGHYG